MRPKAGDIWNLKRLPARLNWMEAGALLGFTEDDIGYLVDLKLLRPLGELKHGCPVWFAAVELDELCRDPKWLARATKAVRERIKAKNDRQKQNGRMPVPTPPRTLIDAKER